MKIIRTAADLAQLRFAGSLSPQYQAYLESLFGQLKEALGDDESDFSLDSHGWIILLDTGEDPRRLPGIGLDHLKQGLLSTWPEFVEVIQLDTIAIYRLLVLYDNEYGHTFLSIRGQLDPEAESWLADQAE